MVYPSGREFLNEFEDVFDQRYAGTVFERVRLRPAAEEIEVISFPAGGDGCYDNLFIPTVMEIDIAKGIELDIPLAIRISQRTFMAPVVPFVAPEVVGFLRDRGVPPARMRGRVDESGWVPPASDP
jgi:hypothetical protein